MRKVAIIGAGSWGTALAQYIAGLGCSVSLWANEREVVESILEAGENRLFLAGIRLNDSIRPTNNLEQALEDADCVLTVMPSHFCRGLYERMLPFLKQEMLLVSATKGLEESSLMRMSEVIRSVVGKRFVPNLAVLSGPVLPGKWLRCVRRLWSSLPAIPRRRSVCRWNFLPKSFDCILLPT